MKSTFFLLLLLLSFVSCLKTIETKDPYNQFFSSENQPSWSGDTQLLDKLTAFYLKTKDEKALAGDIWIARNNPMADGSFANGILDTYVKSDSGAQLSLAAGGLTYTFKEHAAGHFSITNSKAEKFQLYGQTLTIASKMGNQLRKNDTTLNWSSSLYIPKPLAVTGLDAMERVLPISKSIGRAITWVPDPHPANDKGVIIRLRYDPWIEKMRPNTDALPTQRIEKLIIVPDKGHYHLTSLDLEGFPLPLKNFEIAIYRGNYHISEGKRPVAFFAFDYYITRGELNN